MRNARARTRVLAKVTQRLRGIPTSRFAVNSLGIQMGGRQGFIPRLYKLTEVPLSDPHSTAVYTEAQLDKFMSKVTQRVGSGAKTNQNHGPLPHIPQTRARDGSSTHPQLRSPFPLQARAQRAGPYLGVLHLLRTAHLRPHSVCRFRARALGAEPPAPATERSPENPRRSGGSAPGPRPLTAHPPWASLARPPSPLGVRATSPSGACARGGASRTASSFGWPPTNHAWLLNGCHPLRGNRFLRRRSLSRSKPKSFVFYLMISQHGKLRRVSPNL